jgi:hypothetical protein
MNIVITPKKEREAKIKIKRCKSQKYKSQIPVEMFGIWDLEFVFYQIT